MPHEFASFEFMDTTGSESLRFCRCQFIDLRELLRDLPWQVRAIESKKFNRLDIKVGQERFRDADMLVGFGPWIGR